MSARRALFPVLSSILIAAAGCGDPADGGPSATATPSPTPIGDEALFAGILAGDIPPADGMSQIAASGGWPMATGTGYVFARLDDGGGPYGLSGDHDGWQGAPMALEAGVWWLEVVIAAPLNSKYKFVNGAAQYGSDPFSRRFGYDDFGEYSLVDAGGGHLERYFSITDGVVAPRTVRIRVPSTSPTHHLYVHDGQNLFDTTAPFGGWHLQEALGAGTLAIGIDNTPDRMSEYTHVPDDLGGGAIGGAGNAYADFIEDTVRPFVEARYGMPTRVGTMGSSLGGLISFHLAQRHAGRYDFAASLSGTMGWGSIGAANETMIERHVAAGHGSTKLYLDSGGGAGSGCVDSDGDGIQDDAPDDSDNYCENEQFRDALVTAGYAFDVDLWHWWEPDAPHNEEAWAARVFRPVELFESL